MPPRKKSNTGLIIGLVVGGLLLCCIGPAVLLGGGMFWAFNKAKPLVQCTFAFNDVRDGLRLYAAEHNGKLPPLDTWQDEVAPYYEKAMEKGKQDEKEMFGVMSANGLWGCDDGSGGKTGMALNDEVAGKDVSTLETSNTVVLFEIRNAARNAHEKYVPKPDKGGPKLFGADRGWFLVRMSGEPKMHTHGREKSSVGAGPGME
jgi:hypothetical protein